MFTQIDGPINIGLPSVA